VTESSELRHIAVSEGGFRVVRTTTLLAIT